MLKDLDLTQSPALRKKARRNTALNKLNTRLDYNDKLFQNDKAFLLKKWEKETEFSMVFKKVAKRK